MRACGCVWVCSVMRGGRGYMPPLRGEEGGTPEYKYSEDMPACPCGVDRQCLSLFMDEEFDQVRVFFIYFLGLNSMNTMNYMYV